MNSDVTMGDIAWDAAVTAKQENKTLRAEMDDLRARVEWLESLHAAYPKKDE